MKDRPEFMHENLTGCCVVGAGVAWVVGSGVPLAQSVQLVGPAPAPATSPSLKEDDDEPVQLDVSCHAGFNGALLPLFRHTMVPGPYMTSLSPLMHIFRPQIWKHDGFSKFGISLWSAYPGHSTLTVPSVCHTCHLLSVPCIVLVGTQPAAPSPTSSQSPEKSHCPPQSVAQSPLVSCRAARAPRNLRRFMSVATPLLSLEPRWQISLKCHEKIKF